MVNSQVSQEAVIGGDNTGSVNTSRPPGDFFTGPGGYGVVLHSLDFSPVNSELRRARFGDHQRTSPASYLSGLKIPPALRSYGAFWKIQRKRRLGNRVQHFIDHTAPIAGPLPASALDARSAETEPALRIAPLLGRIHKLTIDDYAILGKCDAAV